MNSTKLIFNLTAFGSKRRWLALWLVRCNYWTTLLTFPKSWPFRKCQWRLKYKGNHIYNGLFLCTLVFSHSFLPLLERWLVVPFPPNPLLQGGRPCSSPSLPLGVFPVPSWIGVCAWLWSVAPLTACCLMIIPHCKAIIHRDDGQNATLGTSVEIRDWRAIAIQKSGMGYVPINKYSNVLLRKSSLTKCYTLFYAKSEKGIPVWPISTYYMTIL